MDKEEKIKQFCNILLEEKENIKANKDLVSQASSLASTESLSINNKGIEDDIASINSKIDLVLKNIDECLEKYGVR